MTPEQQKNITARRTQIAAQMEALQAELRHMDEIEGTMDNIGRNALLLEPYDWGNTRPEVMANRHNGQRFVVDEPQPEQVLTDEDALVAQIRVEWEAIEAKRPRGNFDTSLDPIFANRHIVPAQQQRLIDVIQTLHETVMSYHSEMGILLRVLLTTRAQLAEAQEQIEHMLSLKTEYDPGRWSGDTGYRMHGTDTLPYMYSWTHLDDLMSYVPERWMELLEQYASNAVPATLINSEVSHTIALYRHIIRTLAEAEAAQHTQRDAALAEAEALAREWGNKLTQDGKELDTWRRGFECALGGCAGQLAHALAKAPAQGSGQQGGA